MSHLKFFTRPSGPKIKTPVREALRTKKERDHVFSYKLTHVKDICPLFAVFGGGFTIRASVTAISLAVIGGLLWFLLRSEHSPLFFVIYMRHLDKQKERFLCYEIDHTIIAHTLRTFAEQQEWAEVGFNKDDPRVRKPTSAHNALTVKSLALGLFYVSPTPNEGTN